MIEAELVRRHQASSGARVRRSAAEWDVSFHHFWTRQSPTRTSTSPLAWSGQAYDLLAPGGHLRFQLLADPSDPTGIESSLQEVAAVEEEIVAMEEGANEGDRSLIDDHYYMGHAFRYDEAAKLFSSLGGELILHRFDPGHIYGDVTGSASPSFPDSSSA